MRSNMSGVREPNSRFGSLLVQGVAAEAAEIKVLKLRRCTPAERELFSQFE